MKEYDAYLDRITDEHNRGCEAYKDEIGQHEHCRGCEQLCENYLELLDNEELIDIVIDLSAAYEGDNKHIKTIKNEILSRMKK